MRYLSSNPSTSQDVTDPTTHGVWSDQRHGTLPTRSHWPRNRLCNRSCWAHGAALSERPVSRRGGRGWRAPGLSYQPHRAHRATARTAGIVNSETVMSLFVTISLQERLLLVLDTVPGDTERGDPIAVFDTCDPVGRPRVEAMVCAGERASQARDRVRVARSHRAAPQRRHRIVGE